MSSIPHPRHIAQDSLQVATLIHPVEANDADAYAAVVGRALTADRFTLEGHPILSELPAVERWATAHPHALMARGKAIQALLRRAVSDVATTYADDSDLTLRRIAAYVRLRYLEGKSVTAIAEAWQMNRSGLSRRFSRRAHIVVAHRFLQLAEHLCWPEDPSPATRTS